MRTRAQLKETRRWLCARRSSEMTYLTFSQLFPPSTFLFCVTLSLHLPLLFRFVYYSCRLFSFFSSVLLYTCGRLWKKIAFAPIRWCRVYAAYTPSAFWRLNMYVCTVQCNKNNNRRRKEEEKKRTTRPIAPFSTHIPVRFHLHILAVFLSPLLLDPV